MDRDKGKENSSRNNIDEVDSITYMRKRQNGSSCIECQKNQFEPKKTIAAANGGSNNNFNHTLDLIPLLRFNARKLSDPSSDKVPKKASLVKSITIARLFGNNYDTKQPPPVEKLKKPPPKPHYGPYNEKFLKTDSDCVADLLLNCNDADAKSEIINGLPPSAKTFRTLSRGFGKLLRRNYSSVDISNPDPEYKVSVAPPFQAWNV